MKKKEEFETVTKRRHSDKTPSKVSETELQPAKAKKDTDVKTQPEVEALQESLHELGETGIQFIPRLENKESIGKNPKIAEKLNEVAGFVPSVPYSAVVLTNGILYANQPPGISEDASKQIATQILNNFSKNLDIMKVQWVKFDISTKGEHADTAIVTYAIADQRKLGANIETPVSLGIAAFRSKGKHEIHELQKEQKPASCASCASFIRALNTEGYNVSVSLSTPMNFPSNTNYKIPSMAAEDKRLLTHYLNNLKNNLERLTQYMDQATEEQLYAR